MGEWLFGEKKLDMAPEKIYLEMYRSVETHYVDPSSKHRLATTFLVSQANSSPSTFTYTQTALKAVPVLQRIITGI